MATHLYSVTAQDVLDTLPSDTRNVTSTSQGLSTSKVEGFIARASGQISAIITRHGIDPASLGDDEIELIRDAIIAYAGGYSLERLGASGEQINRRFEEWKRLVEMIQSTPQNLGESQNVSTAQKVKSNIDTSNPSHRGPWNSKSWSGW